MALDAISCRALTKKWWFTMHVVKITSDTDQDTEVGLLNLPCICSVHHVQRHLYLSWTLTWKTSCTSFQLAPLSFISQMKILHTYHLIMCSRLSACPENRLFWLLLKAVIWSTHEHRSVVLISQPLPVFAACSYLQKCNH